MLHIDYHMIVENAKKIKSKCGVPLCAVVKSDAYGHGSVRTVSVLDGIVDSFAVGTVEEATKITEYTKSEIAVLLPSYKTDELCFASSHNLVLTICNDESLLAAIECRLPLKCQIKVDSGMSRLGFHQEELVKVCQAIKSSSALCPVGTFSHLWGERKTDVLRQVEYFKKCAEYCNASFGKRMTNHIANTNAAINIPQSRLDAVRIGLGLYGYGNSDLNVAKTVTANVIAVRHVKRGDVLGYGGKNRATKNGYVAVVDYGYSNGFIRTLIGSNVLVGGHRGRVAAVCMGMTLIETANYLPHVGEEAVLLGKQVNPSNFNTIVYELLCNLR